MDTKRLTVDAARGLSSGVVNLARLVGITVGVDVAGIEEEGCHA
jgi:hypothetical protein